MREVKMREVQPSGSGFVCVSRDDPLSTVVFSHASSNAGVGCHGTNMAEALPIRFSPNRSAPVSSGEGPERGGQSITDCPVLADPGMVLRHLVSPGRSADLLSQAGARFFTLSQSCGHCGSGP